MSTLYNKLRYIYVLVKFYGFNNVSNLFNILFDLSPYLNVKLKNGLYFTIRTESIDDLLVSEYVLKKKYHIPPFVLPNDPTIFDLGANIGLTIFDYKSVYPNSKIIGIEMDKKNYALCNINVKLLTNVILINKAIWFEEKLVKYKTNTHNDAFSVELSEGIDSNSDLMVEVESITINNLFNIVNVTKVDFMKMDIEGAEIEIFEKGDLSWLDKVSSLHIEIHDKDKIIFIKNILLKYGFEIIPDENHWCALFAKK